jgi:transposase-like protein
MKSGSATNIIAALDLYYRGLSLRQIAQHLKSTYDIRVSHATVYNWIKKYVKLINEHVRAIQINASERWHADDTLIKVHGRHLVLWALLDSETRFLIAVHISQMRGSDDAQKLMNEGFERSKNKPLELITDGLPSYSIALQNENRKNCGDLMIHLQGPLTEAMNNKMERFFGTLKSRLKTMCRFQNEETAKRFAEGFWFYYNFIKSHKALGGKSPAEKAGIAKDKSWLKWVMGSIKPV